MPRDGTATRERILDATQRLVIAQGFAATSVDDVIEAAATTKGGFFHHFPSKKDLARALVQRYAAQDAAILEKLLKRSERLSRDPLQQLLIFVGLLTEETEEQMRTSPGCLFASFLYERELVDDVTRDVIAESLRHTRVRIRAKLAEIGHQYEPRAAVDLDALADQVTILIEGAYVMVRALGNVNLLSGQLEQFRTYLELLFLPSSSARAKSEGAATASAQTSSSVATP